MDSNCISNDSLCFWIKVYKTMDNIHFYLYVIFLNILIFLISIFSKIKENYRWFVLNQSLFEIIYLSYYGICGINPIHTSKLCFNYTPDEYVTTFVYFIFLAFTKTLYFPMLLLAFSRFSALFFPLVFNRIFVKGNIFFIIFFFDLIWCIFVGIHASCNYISSLKNDAFSVTIWSKIPYLVMYVSHCFLLSAIFMSFLLICRILYRLKKQVELNQKRALLDSLRISFALLIHNVFLLHALIFADGYLISNILPYNKNLRVELVRYFDYPIQYCVFISSFVMLILFSGYRQALWDFLKFLYAKCKNRIFHSNQVISINGH